VYRCQHPRHETTTLDDCRRCTEYSPPPSTDAAARTLLLSFPHGLGDAVQLTTILLHLRHLYPQWTVDVAVRPGAEGMFAGLCRRAYRLGEEPADTPETAYDVRRTLWFHEPDACYADSPATKAEKALREAFQIAPREELCRYEIMPRDEARRRARDYVAELASICGLPLTPSLSPARRGSGTQAATAASRFVLIHYQGNSSRQNKNLDERAVAALCEEIIARSYIPVVLDWDGRSSLVDERRVFCPAADHPLWGGRGHGDGTTLAALATEAAWCVGIDSGPGHVFGATATPTAIVWTGHHPLHYYGLSETVTHLVPRGHHELLRGDRDVGLRYFETKYQHREYWDLARSLVLLAREFLPPAAHAEPSRVARSEQGCEGRGLAPPCVLHPDAVRGTHGDSDLIVDGDHWVRRAHRRADMVIVRDVYLEDCYRVAELPRAPRRVIDVGAHVGAFARRVHHRTARAAVVSVEANEANLPALKANVGDFAHVIPAACTYEPGEVLLFSTVFDGSDNTGGSTILPASSEEARQQAAVAAYRPSGSVPKITLEEIVRRCGWPHIDLLKLDCEGSELSILEHCDPSLLRWVVGEYHDRARFFELIERRFAGWQLRLLSDGPIGLFWLRRDED
jgi:FkbM family methyltransferase